jgi:hypothetical protein
MQSIDVSLLASVIGGAASNDSLGGPDMLKSIDVFAGQLRRSNRRQVRNFANCEYQQSEDRASGDPARMQRAEQTNCRDILAPARRR